MFHDGCAPIGSTIKIGLQFASAQTETDCGNQRQACNQSVVCMAVPYTCQTYQYPVIF